ncbi:hypothetical protein [Paraferrimonas haliotis]|uniref:Secreted protein n=1 Tax=Paraferrimonas haliotis TaxID=2013866 RepID=A0AA37WYX4_9GAMM|nr:hypothetical protein [Paraferrimonas haliotis]GLS83601.1 hypothetical protein GCM10007894_15780 [Paraferrimonas haliotis]
MLNTLALGLAVSAASATINPAPLLSADQHIAFFDNLKPLCGKSFQGEVVNPSAEDGAFATEKLVMHVRECSDNQIKIPFHVGNNASRTWILTRTGSGITLKHDHRLENGKDDPVTMYGGMTHDAGYAHAQSFPADAFSKQLFVNTGIPQSVGNTWHMYIYPDRFTYALTREGRSFHVNFDLTKEVATPVTPWGYADLKD